MLFSALEVENSHRYANLHSRKGDPATQNSKAPSPELLQGAKRSKALVHSPSCGLVEPTGDVSSLSSSPSERFLSSSKQLSADPGVRQQAAVQSPTWGGVGAGEEVS